jgi:hypothetical protein
MGLATDADREPVDTIDSAEGHDLAGDRFPPTLTIHAVPSSRELLTIQHDRSYFNDRTNGRAVTEER